MNIPNLSWSLSQVQCHYSSSDIDVGIWNRTHRDSYKKKIESPVLPFFRQALLQQRSRHSNAPAKVFSLLRYSTSSDATNTKALRLKSIMLKLIFGYYILWLFLLLLLFFFTITFLHLPYLHRYIKTAAEMLCRYNSLSRDKTTQHNTTHRIF